MAFNKFCLNTLQRCPFLVNVSKINVRHKSLPRFLSVSVKSTPNKKPDWNKAVSEAEKIVGYPTSFLSLRWLLSDEIANVALHLRKLVGSNHPLLKTAKSLLYNGRNNMQGWGLIVLLVSKAAGQVNVDVMEEDKAAGVLHSQRALAEITEMIRTGHLVHKGLVHIEPEFFTEPSLQNDMAFGNKIALLSGDYLLANSVMELAMLKNQQLVELMSLALKDLCEGEFIGRRDRQNNPIPSKNIGDVVQDWTRRNASAGSLLGKACLGTLMLAGHSENLQQQGQKFGNHLALAWQACLDLTPFIGSNFVHGSTFNLTSAPVLFHLHQDSELYTEIEKGAESVENIDFKKIYEVISTGPGIGLTKQLQKEHGQRALEVLQYFEESDARTALTNIIVAMGEF